MGDSADVPNKKNPAASMAVARGPRVVVTRSSPPLPAEVVVVLFGWLGANDRQLAKYARMYESNTRSTVIIRGIASTTDIMFCNKKALSVLGNALMHGARAALEAGVPNAKLYIHVFSNGGTFVWEQLTQEMQQLDGKEPSTLSPKDTTLAYLKQRLAGEVFDSSPCYLHFSSGLRAIGHAVPYMVPRLMMQAGFLLVNFFAGVFEMLRGREIRSVEFFSHMSLSAHTCKQMYIYSAADDMLDISKVNELI